MVLAPTNFRDEEYMEPRKILEDNGIVVTVASSMPGIAIGKLGTKATVDITLKEVDITGYNIVIYVGGPGCKLYWDDPIAYQISKEAVEFKKILAAICSAPVILARAGLLKGKNATCYPDDAPLLKKEGAKYTGAPIEQDGLIITADGPDSAQALAARIVQTLQLTG